MNIEKTRTENEICLILSGRIDTTTAPTLHEEIAALSDDIPKVILDIKDMEYISSAGLRELLVCRKRFKDDRMEVINVNQAVKDILEVTGFDTLIPYSMAGSGDDDGNSAELSFKEFLADKVRDKGDRVFLRTAYDAFTWNDIEIASQIIASMLASFGVHQGTHVGLCGLNSANWIFVFYAIQKLGAMAVLINPSLKASEIARICAIGEVTHLCYGELPEMKDDEEGFINEIRSSEGGSGIRFASMRDVRNIRDEYDKYDNLRGLFDQPVDADYPCVMIFTSGSTGRPKGVLLSSYNILNAAKANSADQTLRDTDRTCLILPLFHVFGLVAGLFANSYADSVIYIPRDIRTDTILELISSEKCTIFHSVPTMLIALMNNKAFKSKQLESLRCTIISGAASTKAQIRQFKEAMPGNHFLSSYGMSEMAPVSITEYEDTDEHITGTVGKPVENIRIRIYDNATGKECEPGQSGEIQVQGYNLMLGYFKTSLDDQSIDEDGWLHTGDLGCILPDGYLRLTGRLKELIIRGGENIMPGEVEAVISSLEYVENVKVMGVPSAFFGEEVACALILKEGRAFDEKAIKDELASKLSKFKIPSYFVVYDEFPLLGSGKINTVALRDDLLKHIGR